MLDCGNGRSTHPFEPALTSALLVSSNDHCWAASSPLQVAICSASPLAAPAGTVMHWFEKTRTRPFSKKNVCSEAPVQGASTTGVPSIIEACLGWMQRWAEAPGRMTCCAMARAGARIREATRVDEGMVILERINEENTRRKNRAERGKGPSRDREKVEGGKVSLGIHRCVSQVFLYPSAWYRRL